VPHVSNGYGGGRRVSLYLSVDSTSRRLEAMAERGSLFASPRRTVVAVALILTLPAAACADGDGSEPQPTEPAATGPTATETTNGPSPIGLLYENADLRFTVEYPESGSLTSIPSRQGSWSCSSPRRVLGMASRRT
jgi:hypothetical protein